MGRISLVIADSDEAYTDSLVSFLIRYYPHRFQISSFSSYEGLKIALSESTEKVDVLLISEDLYQDSVDRSKAECTIILSGECPDTHFDGLTAINKYQHGDKLAGDILNTYSEKNTARVVSGCRNRKTQVVSVFSPQGGAGKSCIAVSACVQCAKKGIHTFYLNLEDFSSTSSFFNYGSEANLSDIIYFLKEKNKSLPLKLEGSRCVDAEWGIHYFAPPDNDAEINELSPEDITELIDQIKALGAYDFIFIDMSSNLNPRNTGLLELSDRITLVFAIGMSMPERLERFSADLNMLIQRGMQDIKSKCDIVLNRCMEGRDFFMDLGNCFGDAEVIKVPEVGNMNRSKIIKPADMDSNYADAISRLVESYTSHCK